LAALARYLDIGPHMPNRLLFLAGFSLSLSVWAEAPKFRFFDLSDGLKVLGCAETPEDLAVFQKELSYVAVKASVAMGSEQIDFSQINSCRRKKVPLCLKRAADFIEGHAILYRDREEARRRVVPPPDLLTAEFLNYIEHNQIDKAADYIERLNKTKPAKEKYIAAAFSSHTYDLQCFSYHGRFLIYVPGQPERYVNFPFFDSNYEEKSEFAKPANSCLNRTVSVVGVFTHRNGSRSTYLYDFFRGPQITGIDYPVDPRLNPDVALAGETPTNVSITKFDNGTCLQCHKSGPIPVVADSFWGAKFTKQIELINKTMKHSKYVNGYHTSVMGPNLGADYERSDSELMACIETFPKYDELKASPEFPKTATAMREALRCASCHGQGKEGGILNAGHFNSLNGLADPAANYVHTGKMPKNFKMPLTLMGKDLLRHCLAQEYYGKPDADGKADPRTGALYKWLTEKDCLRRGE
jgi:hypothetical protein